MKVFAPIKDMLFKLKAQKLWKKNHKNRIYPIVMRRLVGLSYLDILAHKTIGLLNYYFFVGNRGNIQKVI